MPSLFCCSFTLFYMYCVFNFGSFFFFARSKVKHQFYFMLNNDNKNGQLFSSFFHIVYLNTLNHKSHCELALSLSWMINQLPSVLDASWKFIVICHQVTSRYISYYWPGSMSPFGINELKGLFPDPNGGKATDNFCNISWWKHWYSPEISVEYYSLVSSWW